jgi:multidrug efflux pump subunit AcrA (membrane-fusion protein)
MTARWNSGSLAAALALIAAGAALSGCTEVEATTSEGYEPATLNEVAGSELKQVTLTAEGAQRTGLRTAPVQRSGDRRAVPYTALIYDGEGKTFVYTAPKPLSFLRAAVAVDRIEGDRVLLTDGPAAGSRVVTTGAAEVYGTELEIAGSH